MITDAATDLFEAQRPRLRRLAYRMLGEVGELWDMVALVEYPSLEAFKTMALSPEMHAIEHHRMAGLAGQLNIRTKPRI